MPIAVLKSNRNKSDFGIRKRNTAKTMTENRTLCNPENTSTVNCFLIEIGIKIRDVIPVNVSEIAAPFNPKIGTKMKRHTIYCIAAAAIKNPDNLGFPIPIKTEVRVYPNISRKVPIIRI